ncbi:MAG: hypothetical protein ACTSX9_04110 [Candidatus Njordarchaeales archaeon]
MSEAYIDYLLTYTAKSSRRPVDCLYELAWGSFALKEMNRDYKHFLSNIRSAIAAIASSSKLMDVLYDYRRSIGVVLSIWLFGTREISFPEDRLDELCSTLVQISRDSGIAELIGVSFLLAKYLGRRETELELRSLMRKIEKASKKNPALYLTDLLSVMFFLAIVDLTDEFLLRAIEDIKQNRYWMSYIEDDPERMALLLYVLSKIAYSDLKNVDTKLAEWCRAESNKLAEILYHDLKKKRLLDSQSYAELIDALLGVAEGFEDHVKQKFGSLVRRENDDEIIVDRKAIAPLPRVDLLAKAYIALNEAGYIRPFMLSRREVDVYKQIQAELKGYRRIRKPELIFLMSASSLFIVLLVLLIGCHHILPIALATIVPLYGHIWKNGHISWKEILNSLRGLTERLQSLR